MTSPLSVSQEKGRNSPTCECCDHPLQHVIRQALDTAENAVPPLSPRVVTNILSDGLAEWEER